MMKVTYFLNVRESKFDFLDYWSQVERDSNRKYNGLDSLNAILLSRKALSDKFI